MLTFDEIIKKALALPAEARAEVAGSLIRSLDEDSDGTDFRELWSTEIAAGIAAIDDGSVQLVTLADVRERLAGE